MHSATTVSMLLGATEDAWGNTAHVLRATVRPTSFLSGRHVAIALFNNTNRSLLEWRYLAYEVVQPMARAAIRERLFSLTLFARLLEYRVASTGSTDRNSTKKLPQ
jgi:hypothetical protein